jgi:hypothetical protein
MTAVEWLTEQYLEQYDLLDSDLYLKAKEMEKQQIIEAYWDGNQDVGYKLLAEQYYKEKFKPE